ncbi:MAG: glycosyltransferase family 39 protein [Acidobacteriia bacterium]|nr:glycosyltransferase family 39 protein [Terriglobia bacterium]
MLEPDEGRNAEVAREMLTSGDLITPHFDSLVYLDKPAAYFWLVAGSFRLLGVNEGAARMPSALLALGTMLLAWFAARRMFGNSAGVRAGIVFATTPLAIAFSRLVIFDMLLAFLVTAALLCFWLFRDSSFKSIWLQVTMFAAMGVATITKGPVGFLLPLLTILAFATVRGEVKELKRLRWGLGVAVFLATTLPWFAAVSVRNPAFPRYALWEESLQRFATSSARRGGNIFYYVPVFLLGFFPWSFFVMAAGWARRRSWRLLREEKSAAVVFALAWVAVIFIFFSISQSKLPGYFLPAVVPLSLLTANAWEGVGVEDSQARPRWLQGGFVALVVLGVVVAALPQAFRAPSVDIALTRKVPGAVVALMKPALFYSGLILVALGLVGRRVTARSRGRTLALVPFVMLAIVVPLLLIRWIAPLRSYYASASSRLLAQTLLRSPERDLPIYAYYSFRTSLVFYLRRPVGLVTTDGIELTSHFVARHLPELRRSSAAALTGPGQPEPLLIDAADLRNRSLHASRPVLVLVPNQNVTSLSQTVVRMEPLWSDWEFSIWKIPAAEK